MRRILQAGPETVSRTKTTAKLKIILCRWRVRARDSERVRRRYETMAMQWGVRDGEKKTKCGEKTYALRSAHR